MKKYPSIPYWDKGKIGSYTYAFDKLDGSNIRVEWDKKLSKKSTSTLGFKKFGTRNQMITHVNQSFGDAVDIFMDKYSEKLDKIFRENKEYRNCNKITTFLEYLGDNSFAGQHEKLDEKDLYLFDVMLFKKGFVDPKNFIKDFGHLDIPKVVYEGIYDEGLINRVRSNDFGVTEGVMCKGTVDKKVWVCKIKTNEWLNKIKSKLGQEELIKEVNGNVDLIKGI